MAESLRHQKPKTFNHTWKGFSEWEGEADLHVHTHKLYPKKTTYNKKIDDTKRFKTFWRKPKDPDYFKKYYLEHKQEGPGQGRPRSEQAQLLGRPLNNQECQQRKNQKRKLEQFFNDNQRQAIKVIDKPQVRVKTKNKIPKRTDWPNYYERLNAQFLKNWYNELGARTGQKVKYWGRNQYFIYVLDEDHYKPNKDIPEEVRREIESRGKERNEKWGVGYNNTKHGRHTIILSREPLPPIALQYGIYQPTDFLGLGQQFIVNGPGKEWQGSRKLLIVKDFWELKRKLEKWGYTVLRKDKQIINKIKPTNIKVYEPLKTTQIIRQSIRKGLEGQKLNIIEGINQIKELTPTKNMREPYLITSTAHEFRAEFYHKNQEKIKLYQGRTAKLTLKWGHTHLFLNKIWSNTA